MTRIMDYKPLISIISPTFNHEKYIAQCIESVLAQTYSNWEMWIVDDGSSDTTASIAAKFAGQDTRIQLISQDNIGIFRLSETYNLALARSKGELIAVLEGDDYWEPDKLELQVGAFLKHPEAVMCWGMAASRVGNSRDIYQIHPVNKDRNISFYSNHPPGNIFNIVFDDFLPPLTYLIKRTVLEKTGGFIQVQPFPAVDLSTVLEISLQGPFVFIDKILGTWRIFPQQTTKTKTVEILEGSQKIITHHYQRLKTVNPEILKFDTAFIVKQYKVRRVVTFARSGRFKLIKKDFSGARRDYLTALAIPVFSNPVWKLRALVGLIFSFLHMDVEILAKWLGKGSFKN
jgi:glycosyltransferase involved in cell wall biosynthesis